MVEQRKKQPTDDLTSALLAAEIDGDKLTDEEIIAFLFLMVVAGNETTTKLLGHALFHLTRAPGAVRPGLRRPGAARRPRRAVDRGDAALRHLQPDGRAAPARGRRAARQAVAPAGSKLLLVIGSANRDDRVFSDPDRYDIFRDKDEVGQLLSFGGGRHFCLGANLARLEAQIALRELVRRVGRVEVDHDACAAGALDQRPRLRLGAGPDGRSALMAGLRPPRPSSRRRHRRLVGHRRRDGADAGGRRSPGGAGRAPHRQARGARGPDPRGRAVRSSRTRSTSPTTSRSTAFAAEGHRRPRRHRGRGQQRRAGRARHDVRGRHERSSRASSTSTSSAPSGWSRAFVPGHGRAAARRHRLRLQRRRRAGPARSCRRTPPASGASRAWRTRCRWSSRAPASAPRSCARARRRARWAPTGTTSEAAFVINQWVRFGLARHPRLLQGDRARRRDHRRSSRRLAASTST